jgi:hypothetical protein
MAAKLAAFGGAKKEVKKEEKKEEVKVEVVKPVVDARMKVLAKGTAKGLLCCAFPRPHACACAPCTVLLCSVRAWGW